MTFRKYTGIILMLVYAFFFASTNFFYHSHQLADSKIIHSHPFSIPGHSHTANQIFLINQIDSADFLDSAQVQVPDVIPGLSCPEFSLRCADKVLSAVYSSHSLRAPPACC